MHDILDCARCGAQTAAGIHLCLGCTLHLEHLLDQLPDTILDATDTIAREDKLTRTTPGGSTDSHPTPANLTAVEEAQHLATVLADWRDEIYKIHDCQTCPPMPDHVNYYQAHTDVIRTRPWANQFLTDLEDNHRALVRVVDLPPERLLLGGCGERQDDGTACPGVIRGVQGRPDAACNSCGAVWDAAELQRWAISEAWHTTAPLAVVVEALRSAGLKLTLKSAQRWASEGDLTPADHGSRGALYTPASVQAVAAAKRARHGGARTKVGASEVG